MKTQFNIKTLALAVLTAVLAPINELHAKLWCLNDIAPEDIKKLQDLNTSLTAKSGELHEVIERARAEVKKLETITGSTNEKLTEASSEAKAASEAVKEFKTRMTEVEQKLVKGPGALVEEQESPGQMLIESAAYADFAKSGFRGNSAGVNIGAAHKTAVLNTAVGGTNPQPLVLNERTAGIIAAPQRRLTIRDLMPQLRTESNLVESPSESTFTNNAGPQFSSPNDRENVLKNESGFTFTINNSPVITLAHWVPVSRQLLADAKGLAGYLDARMMYGLKLKEEDQLLLGDGTGGNLSGLYTGATAYNRSVSNDTPIDCLLRSMLQVTVSEYSATGFVLNPIDWTNIRLLKDTVGRYLFSDPQSNQQPRMWDLPVVSTNSMTAGTFLTGAFDLAAAIWDREDAVVRMSENYSDYFARNMMVILVEERLTITVFRALALIKGTLPVAGS